MWAIAIWLRWDQETKELCSRRWTRWMDRRHNHIIRAPILSLNTSSRHLVRCRTRTCKEFMVREERLTAWHLVATLPDHNRIQSLTKWLRLAFTLWSKEEGASAMVTSRPTRHQDRILSLTPIWTSFKGHTPRNLSHPHTCWATQGPEAGLKRTLFWDRQLRVSCRRGAWISTILLHSRWTTWMELRSRLIIRAPGKQ